MEAITGLAMPLIVAAGVISLYAVLRLVVRSDWMTSDLPAYALAVLMTFAIAGSLFSLGIGLSGVMSDGFAFLGTFLIHGALVWLFQSLLPISANEADSARISAQRVSA